MCNVIEPRRLEENDSSEGSEEGNTSCDETSECEEDVLIRAKWIMDGAATLEDAIRKVEAFANYLRGLKEEGYELREPIGDDYGFLIKS